MGEAGVFSEGDEQAEDGGGPVGGGRPLLYGGRCRGSPLLPCGSCDYEVLDAVRVLVP